MKDADKKIKININPEYEDIVPVFLENRRKDIAALKQALEGKDYAAIRTIGHNMKGVGSAYGFDYITALGGQIEMASARQDAGGINMLAEDLQKYLSAVEISCVRNPEQERKAG